MSLFLSEMAIRKPGSDSVNSLPVQFGNYELPSEIAQKVFSYLGAEPLAKCNQVSRTWRAATTELAKNAFFREVAFGKEKWEHYFGEVVEEPPLPDDIYQILTSLCPFWEGKRIYETHKLVLIPATVNDQPLTFNLLDTLIQHPLNGGHATRLNYNLVRRDHSDTPVGHSYWVLMTKDAIPEIDILSSVNGGDS